MYRNEKYYSSGSTLALQAIGSKPLFPIVTSNSTMLFKPVIFSSSTILKILPGDLCCLNLSQILMIGKQPSDLPKDKGMLMRKDFHNL